MVQYWRVAAPATRYDSMIAQLQAAALPSREAPPDFGPYLDKVRRHAYAVTDEDVQAEITRLAGELGLPLAQAQQQMRSAQARDALKSKVREDKAMSVLSSAATIQEA